MKNVADNICRESPNTHFVANSFFLEYCAIYEIMLKNMVQPDKLELTI